ncbi:MAG: manganese efflux pump [Opitutales bacterium]|nr:manganese efflux pump [Opitutales bacterium]
MTVTSSLLLGFALAVDAMLVAFAYGLILNGRRWNAAFSLAGTSAFFQTAMPVAGFFITSFADAYIAGMAPLISAVVFCALGGNVIFNTCRSPKSAAGGNAADCPLRLKTLLGIGIATSIDALVCGAGIRCETLGDDSAGAEMLLTATVIGLTTFFCVFLSFWAARIFRAFPQKIAGTAAGLILIAMGIFALVR